MNVEISRSEDLSHNTPDLIRGWEASPDADKK